MQVNELLDYRDKFIEAFKDGTFLSKDLKKSDDAAYDYVLKDVKSFIQKIELISENINLSLLKDFFEWYSPADYAKDLIDTKNANKNKEIVAKIKYRMSDLKDRIKEISKRENKSADEKLNIIEKILDYKKGTQKAFACSSKIDKGKSDSKSEESIAKRVRLRREKITEIKEEERNINNELFKKYFTDYHVQVICTKTSARQKVQLMRIEYI